MNTDPESLAVSERRLRAFAFERMLMRASRNCANGVSVHFLREERGNLRSKPELQQVHMSSEAYG